MDKRTTSEAATTPWRTDMENAPRDGRFLILLPIGNDIAYLGRWNPRGTSWVNGDLCETGTWTCAAGWFQPNEIRAWHPIDQTSINDIEPPP